jgi:hypothetical protein
MECSSGWPTILRDAVVWSNPGLSAHVAPTVRDLGAAWIGNKVPGVFPGIAAKAARPRPTSAVLLSVNGEPVAWTDPHGGWIDWIADPCILHTTIAGGNT